MALLGGPKRAAGFAGRSANTVWRWLEPVESGGHGGLIPNPAQRKIIAAARAEGIDLSHADFGPRPGEVVL